MGFMDLEKAYDRVNREVFRQVLRTYDVGGNLLNVIKSMCVNSLTCIKVKGGESEFFRINSGVRQGYVISPWLFTVYMYAVMKEVKMGIGVRGVRFQEEGREWRLPDLLYSDDLVLCSESGQWWDDLLRCEGKESENQCK